MGGLAGLQLAIEHKEKRGGSFIETNIPDDRPGFCDRRFLLVMIISMRDQPIFACPTRKQRKVQNTPRCFSSAYPEQLR